MDDITTAIALACKAHAGQVDKAGAPYILHPLRLMLQMREPEAQIVAVLHDVVEDSSTSLEDLKQLGFAESVISAIDCLTRRSAESYAQFIDRLAPNALARSVKIRDLLDNLDTTRLPTLSGTNLERLMQYHTSLRRLQDWSPERNLDPAGQADDRLKDLAEASERGSII